MQTSSRAIRPLHRPSRGPDSTHEKVRSRRSQRTTFWQSLVVLAMTRSTDSIRKLSDRNAIRFGNSLGTLAYHIARRQRRRSVANLHLAFGDEMTLPERLALTRQVFQHFGRGVIDFLRAPGRSRSDLEALVACEGWSHAETALRNGKGMILITGHLGNWELLGRWLTTVRGLPLTVVARAPENPAFAAYIRSMREDAGFVVLDKGGSARGLLRALNRGEVILLLADQSSADIFAPFFGIPAGTAAGGASLALHTGAALVPVFCVEKADHTFEVVFYAPIDTRETCPPEEGESDSGMLIRQKDLLRITSDWNAVLEMVVRRYPNQWLWLHNRWKSTFAPERRAMVAMNERDFEAAYRRWKQ